MVHDFYRWWADQLMSLLPANLRAQDERGRDAIILDPLTSPTTDPESIAPPPTMRVTLRRRGEVGSLGPIVMDSAGVETIRQRSGANRQMLPVHLRVPASHLLEKEIQLPLATERDLAKVIAFEMDRETPFNASEVHWDYEVISRDRVHGRLTLRLSIVPRGLINGVETALETAGLPVSAIEIGLADGTERQIRLDPVEDGVTHWTRRALPVTASACAALAILAVVIPFIEQSLAFRALETRAAALRPDVEKAEALRRRIEGSGGDQLAAERLKVGDAVKILAAASDVLPDDTHLTDLTLHLRKLTLGGQSSAAAKLIGALTADPAFKDPEFAAPITRIEGLKVDAFSIAAEATP
jgi:general secretion pathway protein L